jgi:hypothetical protein
MADRHRNIPYYDGPNNPGFFTPPNIDNRATAQGSIFSISRDPFVPVSREPTFIIPATYRQPINKELIELGIHEASLYPDLDGVARWITELTLGLGSSYGVKEQPIQSE